MGYRTGVVLVTAAGLLWSVQALVIRQIDGAGSWAVLVWRSLAMLPVLLVFLSWRHGGPPWPAIRQAGGAGILGGVGLVAAMGGTIMAFQTTTVANAAFLLAAAPFMAAVLGRVVLRERVPARTWAAIAIALSGIFVMVRDGLAAGAWVGNLAGLVASLGFAVFTVALRWRRLDDGIPCSILGSVLAVILGVAIAAGLGQSLILSASDLFWCLLMGAVTLSGGMILYTQGSKVLPSAQLVLLSNVELILAPFWVWLVLGETASRGTLLGGAILLSAIVVNAAAGVRQRGDVTPLRPAA